MNRKFSKYLQGPLAWVLLLVVILVLVQIFGGTPQTQVQSLDYSEVLDLIEQDKISNIMITGNRLVARTVDSTIPVTDFGNRYDIITTISSARCV